MLGGTPASAPADGPRPLADILPVADPPRRRPVRARRRNEVRSQQPGLNSYILLVGSRTETATHLGQMTPILGTNRFGELKKRAKILAETPAPNPEPLMICMDGRRGPVDRLRRRHVGLVSGLRGEPARASQVLEAGHLLALAQGKPGRQPGQGEARPPAPPYGENIEMTVTARDAKGASIPDVAVGRPTRPEPTPGDPDLNFAQSSCRMAPVARLETRDGTRIGRQSGRIRVNRSPDRMPAVRAIGHP